MKALDWIDKALAKVETVAVMVLLCGMVAVVTLQVINQAFLHLSITWTEEVSRIMMVWSLMIGSCMAVRKGSHLAVDFVYLKLKGTAKYICRMAVLLICIYITFYVGRSGIDMVRAQAASGSYFGITHLPTYVASTAIPVAFFGMSLRFLILMIRENVEFWKNRKEKGGVKEC